MENSDVGPIELQCFVRDGQIVVEICRPGSEEWSELSIDPGLASQLVLGLQRKLAEVARARG